MLFRKEKKCLSRKLYIIVLLLFVPFFIVLNTTNVFALTKDYTGMTLRLRYSVGSSYEASGPFLYGVSHARFDVKYVDRVAVGVNVDSSTSSNSLMTVTAKYNLVSMAYSASDRPYNNSTAPFIYDVVVNGTTGYTAESSTVSVYQTDWTSDIYNDGTTWYMRTFTYEVSFVVRNIPTSITTLAWGVEYPGRLQTDYSLGVGYYFEYDSNNYTQIDFSNDYNSALMQQQIQQQQLIINSIENLNEGSDTYYNNYYESVDNIEGQSSSDIPNSSSNQTTSIIGTISSFVTALGTVQASNCQLTLPFPQFIGGDTTVDVCSGKEKAPTIVSVGSSLFMIGVFVPFAFVVLKMIYNEIRSFTNG